MKISNNTVVSFHYQLTDESGNIVEDSRKDGTPSVYLHGANNTLPGLEQALAAGESENVFFKYLKAEGFVPTSRKDETKSLLTKFIPYDTNTLMEQIIDDPDRWSHELTRRVTTRLVYLETQAEFK